MKKKWFAIPLAVGLLTLALTGGALFAHGGGSGGFLKASDTAARVAEILDLEESEVQSAFNQVIRENQDERMQGRLDRMVENERITQELADAVINWFQDRPDPALHLRRPIYPNEEALQRVLDRMLENEVITEAEADTILAWYDDRPEELDALVSNRPERQQRGEFQRGPQGGDGAPQQGFRGNGRSGFPGLLGAGF